MVWSKGEWLAIWTWADGLGHVVTMDGKAYSDPSLQNLELSTSSIPVSSQPRWCDGFILLV